MPVDEEAVISPILSKRTHTIIIPGFVLTAINTPLWYRDRKMEPNYNAINIIFYIKV